MKVTKILYARGTDFDYCVHVRFKKDELEKVKEGFKKGFDVELELAPISI